VKPAETYGEYLRLDQLLATQLPRSACHDEMLFIILHQTKELWIKQMMFEIEAAQALIRQGGLAPAYKNLARVSRIQTIMTMSWDVLTTMTPSDYMRFRGGLGTSSGFQSAQFRRFEFALGLKDAAFLAHHQGEDRAALEAALAAPSLYDDVIAQLASAGLVAPRGVSSGPHVPDRDIEAAWLSVYRQPDTHWPLYQMAEKLLDIDDALLAWRHKHAITVERIIGAKRGTGGTEGVSYLKSTLTRRCFPELWSVRTQL